MTMLDRWILVIFLGFCLFCNAFDLDCEDYDEGDECVDHEQCCGGCCFDGICIDTYRSCLSLLDVCRDHACIGEENCFAFMPPQCPACEPIPLCRI